MAVTSISAEDDELIITGTNTSKIDAMANLLEKIATALINKGIL